VNDLQNAWVAATLLAAIEVIGIVLLAAVACRWIRTAGIRRALWQASFVAVGCVFVVEAVGWRRAAPVLAGGPDRVLTVTLRDAAGVSAPEAMKPDAPTRGPGTAAAEGTALKSPARVLPWLAWVWGVGAVFLGARFLGGRLWLLATTRKLPRLQADAVEDLVGLPGASPVMAPTGNGVATSSSPFQSLSQGDEDIATPKPFPMEAMSGSTGLPDALRLQGVRWVSWRGLRGPVAFGMFRPTVAIPEDFEERFTPAQRRSMLAHEVGHLAGRDPLWFAVVDLICALGWWHPVLWWARRRLKVESEWVADEAAAAVPGGRLALAESLAVLGRELVVSGGLGVGGSGLKSDLAARVQRLIASEGPVRVRRSGWIPALGMIAVAALAWLPLGMPRGNAGPTTVPATAGADRPAALAPASPSPSAGPLPQAGTPALVPIVSSSPTPDTATSAPAITPTLFPDGHPSLGYVRDRWPGTSRASYYYVSLVTNASRTGTVVAAAAPKPSSSAPSSPSTNASVPVIELQVKWVEFTEAVGGTGWLDWIFGDKAEAAEESVRVEDGGIRTDRVQTTNQWRALDEGQYKALLKRFEETAGIDLLSAPGITTLAGRQAQVSVVDVRKLAVGPRNVPATNGQPAKVVYDTVDVPVGTTVDLVPRFESGRHHIWVLGQYTELMGYDAPAKTKGGSKSVPALPRLRVRNALAEAQCEPGETLVLRGPVGTQVVRWKDQVPVLGSIPVAGRLFRKEGVQTNLTRVYLFITPRVVE
jgi:Zn-dependent protease with chaperone function